MNSRHKGRTFLGVTTRSPWREFRVTALPPNPTRNYEVAGKTKNIGLGEVVSARFEGMRYGRETVSIQEVLKAGSTADLAIESCLRSFDLPRDWSSEISQTQIPSAVAQEQCAGRKDLRRLPMVTIDGQDAKDFDDAVYCSPTSQGWRLVVAIADVAEYVQPGTTIDKEARKRGTSVYLPNFVVPMLPTQLSNGICSLRPFEDRLAIVCDMTLNRQGQVLDSEFSEAVIRSHARLTYREVADYLKTGGLSNRKGDIKSSLSALVEAYRAMSKAAEQRGSIDFNTNESRVELAHGEPVGVMQIERNPAHGMIEMSMIAANVEAAQFLEKHNRTPIYRIHEKPDSEDMDRVREMLRSRNINVPNKIEKPKQIRELLKVIRERIKSPKVWEMAVLMGMLQARYGISPRGHFGLALETYVHFTSPIRRYPDLLIHRLIKSVISQSRTFETTAEELKELGLALSNCERRAVDLERQVDKWLKCVLVDRKLKRPVSGSVTSVQPFGLFVEMDTFGTTGLVHVSRLGDEYFEFEDGELVGDTSGKRYRFGATVEVMLRDVDPPLGRIDLALA